MRVPAILIGLVFILAACGGGAVVPSDESNGTLPGVDSPAQPIGETPAAPSEQPADPIPPDSTPTTSPEVEDEMDEEAKEPIEPVVTPTTEPPAAGGPAGEVPDDLMAAILSDAESRLTTKASAITVVRGQAVTWSDGSLGCPEPGMFYTQALVDGYWVVLDAGGTEMDYRATSNGWFRLCEGSGSVPPTSPSK